MNMPSIQTSQHSKANKLIVVGHPYSNLEFVVDVMQQCSVSPASKLQKEGIAAEDISQILLKAHGRDPKSIYEQVHINPVWNGLAMDLMMSNIEHSKWVWADSDALPLLNYWKSIDNSIAFVLVYNSPQKALQEMIENTELDLEENLEQVLQNWQKYNRAMLNFFYRNPECSLLVNSEQVGENSQKYLQEVGKQIGLNNEEIIKTVDTIEEKKQNNTQQSELYEYFVRQFVDENESAKQLYMELESIANLPSLKHNSKSCSLEKALKYYILEQKEKEELTKKLEQESKRVQESQSENELQLTQLMSVQEELEKNYLAKRDIENKLQEISTKLDNTVNELSTVKTNYKQTQKEKEELTKKLEQESKRVQETPKTKELVEENKLLLEQLHLVQEELEKYYIENQNLKNKKYNSVQKQRYYGAAERVKKHLSYRLGIKMIENSKTLSGIIGLPFSLCSELIEFKKERKTREKLPPISIYMDACDAENVKGYLSYRLGQAMIKSMKSPFGVFKLPFALKRAHNEYKKERN
ncbi:MAG: hypothetical protein IE909_09430 [Campylobacterales bacterium]|nr:hypothetical protein [Campylobacterales bacterium]